MVNSIPVVASKVGGLQESVGKAGILINEFVNPKIWISEIENLLNNKKLYLNLSKRGAHQSRKFDFKKSYSKFIKLLNRVYGS